MTESGAYPKIELHVHLEGTVRPRTLLEIARRNDYALPASTVEGLEALWEFRDFTHFIEVWILTTNALQKEEDFRQVVVDYAAEAASHGAVYWPYGDTVLGTHERQLFKLRDIYTIDMSGDPERSVDRRLIMAIAVGMDALQAR